MSKKAKAVSIIGGADGPTSVFIVGRSGKPGLKQRIKQRIYRWRRVRVEKKISATPHTLDEVITYMRVTYGAVELPKESHHYKEQYECLKESLILKHKPELLGELQDIGKPERHDEEALRAFFEKLKMRTEKAAEISEESFQIDYHIYEIRIEKVGKLHFDVEKNYGILGGSYSGSKKGMKKLSKISKDIYTYYGVSKEDIETKSERFQSLVTTLAT